MTLIQVMFEVPNVIYMGLANGTLERIGGIIRDTDSKQVVAWLREGATMSSHPGSANTIMTSIFQSSSAASLKTSAILGGSVPLLNATVTGFTVYQIMRRIQIIQAEVEAVANQISEEFTRDRRTQLETALEIARDASESEDGTYKHQSAARAIEQLTHAKKQILVELDAATEPYPSYEQCHIAQCQLLKAMHIDTLRIRCYLETDQHKLARARLAEIIDDYRHRTKMLVRQWLGKYPALYFHADVSDEHLQRYLGIEVWLRDKADILYEVIQEVRKDFWKKDAIKTLESSMFSGFNLPGLRRGQMDKDPLHLLALTHCEILIENFHRLLGFELELASLRLRFSEWETMLRAEDSDDTGIIVDTEALERLERLSQ